jgi:2-polyprenyl-6-methoxyphenol hydroxylase-like FAD-dependent oxidoreductase
MHMRRRHALIIGAGIAGPVAAMALQRAGIDTTVYEAHPGPAEHAGLFLNVASNGLDALRALGVDLAAQVDGFPMPELALWSGAGKRLGTVANGLRLADGTVSLCVRRGQLQRALADEALRRNIPIVYGKRLVGLRPADDRVVAQFADGSEARGDVLVGADGIHSAARRLLAPEVRPVYTGQLSLGGYARRADMAPTPGTQHLVFGRRAFFGYLVREGGETWWFANVAQEAEPGQAEGGSAGGDGWQRRLLDLFRDDTPRIAAIIRATEGPIGAYPIYDIPRSPLWHRGRAVLLGDAVHATSPSSGQGASLALEDAVVLAKCLRDLPDAGAAFQAYERLRRPRAERVVAYSRRIGQSKALGNRALVWLRDALMPVALRHFAGGDNHAWLYAYHIDWQERIAEVAPVR